MPAGFRPESRRIQARHPRPFPGWLNCLGPPGCATRKVPSGNSRLQANMPEAIDLLTSRRSVKPIELDGPGPTAAEIATLLTVASRVPDHGKLTPWRFIVFEGDARLKAGETIAAVFRDKRPDATPDQVEHERQRLARAPLVDRGREPRRPACENSGMGAGAVRRRRRNEPGVRRACARLCRKLAHRMVRLRPPRARRARRRARGEASPASSISAGRPSRPKTGRARRSIEIVTRFGAN